MFFDRIRLQTTVRFKAEGGDAKRLIARLQRAGVELWELRFFENGFTASCTAADYKRFLPPVRHTGMRVSLQKKRGLLYHLARRCRRVGIPIGFAVAVLLFLLLCPRIWVIELHCEDSDATLSPALQEEIFAYLADHRVKIGAEKRSLSPLDIRWSAPVELPRVAALSVNLSGCVAHVSVFPRTVTPSDDLSDVVLSNLVATRDGVITRCEVTSGKRICLVGEGVTKGTLLATGVVETEAGPLLRRATGKVFAETERVISVTVPFCETTVQPSGKTIRRYTLSGFGMSAPLYTSLDVAAWPSDTVVRPLTLFGREMPLSVTRQTLKEPITVSVRRSKAQAKAEAMRREAVAASMLFSDATILSRAETVTADKTGVTLTATYKVTENIAEEVPVKLRK